ncbi:leucine-rich repeat domain-containing protein [Adlercreutzia sp. ZJ242]|uniref:leucine-rich repeat domain-containing protein n=1 Tax=Adlercreutzia sp. ZJ242 TaxID=2709409 RepID=UPI0013EAB0A9|nr:leucine-rich repeat domain-containing protein [Adlercreutzia sp. ZJ242]
MGVSYAVDLSKLDACFGGFTPMALSDGIASKEQMAEAERRLKARRASLERAAAIEAARASDERTWVDDEGSTWRYVVLDDAEVRVEKCEARASRLRIPAQIEGKPVVALAPDACAYLPDVEEVTCPDTIMLMGFCAFRGCRQLRRAVLPKGLATFDSDWFRSCANLEHLTLPDGLAKLDASLFDLEGLRVLVVGSGAGEVAPGAFAKSKLTSIEVSADNPFLATDGRALYSRDGSVLVALAVPGRDYAVSAGCRMIAKKGLSHFACLEHVEVPDSLEVLGPFAYARTGVSAFEAPAALKHIGEKAFFGCAQLERVRLREGLLSIDDDAFTRTRLRELRVPASVEELGHPLAAYCDLTYAGPDATFSIAEGSAHLELDEAGCLYHRGEEGLRLLRMMDPEVERYAVKPGTVSIGEGAFAMHGKLRAVVLPEGLVEIGDAAFKSCRALCEVNVPASVRRIGDEALLETVITHLEIPAGLEDVGLNALVTYGAHHGNVDPSLREVTVRAGNARFYTLPGLLLERKPGGRARVLLCTGAERVVRVPEEVDEIAPYAFNAVRGLEEIHLSDRIQDVGIRGLAVGDLVGLIRIDLAQPVEGHAFFEWRFPQTDRGAQQQMLALSVPRFVNPEMLFEHYDNAIVNANSFDHQSDAGLGVYDQAVLIMARLADPVYLSAVNRSLCERALRDNIEDVCVEIAKHDDRRAIDSLLDLGYLNGDNLYRVIDRVGALQDASMTGYLLEVKRTRFGQDAFDFDL